jgi:hypothetical protein
MTTVCKIAIHSTPYGLLIALFVGILTLPSEIMAQSTGNNAAFNGTGGVTGSTAFIDASAFSGGGNDMCAALYSIMSAANYPPAGAVIDARGFNLSNATNDGSNLTCLGTPWFFNGTSTPHPATILLPFTQIVISRTWVLPNGSRIVGKAPGFAGQASLKAGSNFVSPMIQMGNSQCPANGCTGIAIEHLTLDASNQFIDTIDNSDSQEQSYVDDVNLKNVGLTGLKITAPNSGPYSNIRFTAANCSTDGSQCPLCVDIEGQTKGLHGITCAGPKNPDQYLSTQGHAAIWVNASNNSIENVHVEGFWDAVEVGNIAATVGNVTLANVTGAHSGSGDMRNTIHICGPHINTNYGQCNHTGIAKDVTILQAFGARPMMNDVSPFQGVLRDDVTGTTIASPALGVPSSVGIYVLGEPVPGTSTTQYSRFSTSTNTVSTGTLVANWGVGATAVGVGTTCNTPGALYSNTSGQSGSTIFVCTKSTGTLSWQDID